MALPIDDRDGKIWLNDGLVEWRDAKIHVLTHGLHYASSVFEGERLYDGVIFKGHEHSLRLLNSARLLEMPTYWSAEDLDRIKNEVVKANNLKNAYVRAFIWRGPHMGVSTKNVKTCLGVAAWEWGSYYNAEKRENGISLITSKWRKPPADSVPSQSKAGGLYMIGTLSKNMAEDAGFDDALMLDYRGLVAEASSANLFIVKDGVLKTPIPDCFLNGITRQTVIQLAKDAGIPFEEIRLEYGDLKNVDEIFVTGTAAEVMAVGRIDDMNFKVGPVTRKLQQAFEKLVWRK